MHCIATGLSHNSFMVIVRGLKYLFFVNNNNSMYFCQKKKKYIPIVCDYKKEKPAKAKIQNCAASSCNFFVSCV